jgi:hypothetical protein
MDIRKLISKFLTQICEKNYSQANTSLNQIVEAKTKKEIEKVIKGKKATPFKKDSKKDSKKPVSAKQAAFLKKIGATKKVSKKGSK